MATFYYPDDAILARWESPQRPGIPRLLIVLSAVVLIPIMLWCSYTWYLHALGDRNARRASVMVLVDSDGDGRFDQSGSGVIISPKGYVLTSRHLLTDAKGNPPKKVSVLYLPGSSGVRRLEATVELVGSGEPGSDPRNVLNDWGVLRMLSSNTFPYLVLATATDFNAEERVNAYGFLLGDRSNLGEYGPAVDVQRGMITRVDYSNSGTALRLRYSAALATQMTGGALTTQDGRLVGLTTSSLSAGSLSANESYAIPAALLNPAVFQQFGPEK